MDNPQDMKPQRDVLEVQAGPQGPTLAEAAPAEPAQVDITSASAHGPLTAQGSAPPPGESGAVTMHGEVLAPPRRSLKRFILPVLLITALGYGAVKFNDWFTEGRFLVGTDDAYVKADMAIIAAKVTGFIAVTPAPENAAVKAGDILAKIDDGDYQLAVAAARGKMATQDAAVERIAQQKQQQLAVIAQARAQLLSAKADAVRAASEFTRSDALARSDFGTKQRLDLARADRDRTAAAVTSAEAAIVSAQAASGVIEAQRVEALRARDELATALAKAESDLSYTIVRAPFDRVIGNKAAQVGQLVQPGTRLLALGPMASAYIEANMKETQLTALKPRQKVDITVDALGGRVIVGEVESLAPASGSQYSLLPPENATGNFTKIVQRVPVRIRVPDSVANENVLRPGLSVVVSIHTRDPDQPAPSLVQVLDIRGRLAHTVDLGWSALAAVKVQLLALRGGEARQESRAEP